MGTHRVSTGIRFRAAVDGWEACSVMMLGCRVLRCVAVLGYLGAVLVVPADLRVDHPVAGSTMGSWVVTHDLATLPAPVTPPVPGTPPSPTALAPVAVPGLPLRTQPYPGLPARSGRVEPPRIALTFDSNMTDAMVRLLATGKVNSYANVRVIDELQRSHTPATFFLAGKWVERYPDVTRRIAADSNFELASHSYSHRGFTAHCYHLAALPVDQMAADVERSFRVLAPFGGRQTRYFRFPGGCYDARALHAIAPAQATVVQYDIVGGDAFSNDPRLIINNVLRNAHNGGIVVLHITQANAPRTAEALPTIISGLRARGYQLVRVSELLTARSPQTTPRQ
ncbi:MAG TPA: polysaccharide deacetylase family protein [Pseudonocardiaceae bacterium]|nr:polysaccharide deacetylase family protein [Pseudonocardiaceae bacterium]